MSVILVGNRIAQPTHSHPVRRALTGTLVSAAFLYGCAGGVGSQNNQTTTPPPATQTYSISGTISPAAGGSGATITLTGAAAATTTANSSGSYSFAGLANGMYSVTPSNSGYTFSPANQIATISAASVTGVNFTAVMAQAHSVSLSWDASTSTVAGYNVYRSTVSSSGFIKLNSSLVASLTYTDTAVQNGTTYFYVTTAVDSSGNESVDSNQVSVTIP
jgi:SdrD B-like domain